VEIENGRNDDGCGGQAQSSGQVPLPCRTLPFFT
jgi:hypothetical protein